MTKRIQVVVYVETEEEAQQVVKFCEEQGFDNEHPEEIEDDE